MGELVEEHDPAALDGPLARGAAEHEQRPQHAGRHGDGDRLAFDEVDAA